MLKSIIFTLIFTLKFSSVLGCTCFSSDKIDKIYSLTRQSKSIANDNYLYELVTWRKKDPWEIPFFNQYRTVQEEDSTINVNYNRYPSVLHKLKVLEKRINLINDYRYEKAFQYWLGPEAPYSVYTKIQKEEKIRAERLILINAFNKVKNFLESSIEEIVIIYQDLYEKCLKKHASLTTYYDYGLLGRLNNNYEISLNMLQRLMDEAIKGDQKEILDSCFYHELGSACFEAMAYNEAIEYLTESISKDPNNKSAYFDRAMAYFETGNFEAAHLDYLSSNKVNSSYMNAASNEFTNSLLSNVLKGVQEGAVDFVPSMATTVYGLGKTLWIGLEHPIDSVKNFANACHAFANNLGDYCKNANWETLEGHVEQIKTLYESFDQLNDAQKGELIGYTIGRYGVDIFAGGIAFKGIQAFNNLRNANRICNLEALAVSNANKQALVASAHQHALEREAFFKNIKLHHDKQNKHIIGKHNFREGNSVLEHQDPENLLRRFAGKGRKISDHDNTFGASYRENVDFQEYIGIWKNNNGESLPTTKGTIHYGKDNAHIVPAHPDAKVF